MERLTEKTVGCFEYALKDHKAVPGEFGTYDAFFDYSMAVNRLGHYEDTGLEPEEIKVHEAAKYNAGYYHGDEDRCRWIEKELGPIDHIRDLLKAEQEGRLVVMPSKTVWELTMDAGPDCDMKCPVDAWDESLGCDLCSKAMQFAYERPCTQERLKELGKTIFLTREEAEAELAQKGGKDHA